LNLRDYPGLWPGLALSVVIGLLVSERLSRAIGVTRFVAWALVVGFGLALAATLTPSAEAIRFGAHGSGSCDLGRLTLAPLAEILEFGETGLNVVLFIPLGFALSLAPRSRIQALLILASVALPVAIELIQLVVTSLGRTCQSADVVDNLTGLVIGLACGTILGAVLQASTRSGSFDDHPRSR
jgi:glycopeptide antibiotics resistance protein